MHWSAWRRWKQDDRPNFTGKAIVVRCTSGRGGGVLVGVKIVRIGFNNYLVGRKVEADPLRPIHQSGIASWFNFNMIAQMHIFDDLESAQYWHEADLAGI